MNFTQESPQAKTDYYAPTLDISVILYTDAITTSGKGDKNQGEWDPQAVSSILTV